MPFRALLWVVCSLLSPGRAVPLLGNSTLGYYFVNVYLGPQAEEQSLIFDTGSDATLVDCSLCVDCGSHAHAHYHLRYDNRRNNPNGFHAFTCPDPACRFTQSYSEGSTYYGTFVRDTVRLTPNAPSFEAIIGCVSAETGLFVTQDADGILGASPFRYVPELPQKDPPSLLEAALLEGRASRNLLTLCLAKDGGMLGFGDSLDSVSAASHSQKVTVSPDTWAEFYKIPVRGLRVGSEELELAGLGHLDSGTTLTYLPGPVHKTLLLRLQTLCRASRHCRPNDLSHKCFGSASTATEDDFYSDFPDLHFLFDNANIAWRPRDYFVRTESGQFCLLVEVGDSVILGASFMTNKLITFDRSAFSVTFADAECAAPSARTYRHRAAFPTRFNHALNQIVAASESSPPGRSDTSTLLIVIGLLLFLLSLGLAAYLVFRSRPVPYLPLDDTPAN